MNDKRERERVGLIVATRTLSLQMGGSEGSEEKIRGLGFIVATRTGHCLWIHSIVDYHGKVKHR